MVYGKELADRPGVARRALGTAARVIALSRYSRDEVIAAGAKPDRVRIVPPGVDPPGDDPLPPRPNGRPTIVTVARLAERYKGFDVILRSLPLVAARVPEVRWVVVGDGPLRGELEATAVSLGVADRVLFVGAVSDAERTAWLDRSHVFAMVSRVPAGRGVGEGFGLVYLEAAARGLPVVAANVGGSADAVVDGQTGLLVDPADHVAVADALTQLLRDRDLAARLGAGGLDRARSLSWHRMADEVLAILEEVA
jgi:phosphatidylinositol alpha-1,6-mannosyltransferase